MFGKPAGDATGHPVQAPTKDELIDVNWSCGQCGRLGKKPLKFPNGQKRDKPSKDHNAAQHDKEKIEWLERGIQLLINILNHLNRSSDDFHRSDDVGIRDWPRLVINETLIFWAKCFFQLL
jgi:hypothetical protein